MDTLIKNTFLVQTFDSQLNLEAIINTAARPTAQATATPPGSGLLIPARADDGGGLTSPFEY